MKKTIRGESAKDMKHSNRLLVLKLLCTKGAMVRSTITKETGLSKMTTTNIITDLIQAGLVCEEPLACDSSSAVISPGSDADSSSRGAGRKPTIVRLSDTSPCVGGIYIGRRSCSVLITDLSAKVLWESHKEYAPTLTKETLVPFISQLFLDISKACPRQILRVGITAPGPLDSRSGRILTSMDFFGMEDFPICQYFEEALGLPCTLVHDTSAAALAELLYGAGKEKTDFISVHLQHGIGAGLIIHGKLFDGALGLGGELGHTSISYQGKRCSCGNRGCLELYANEETLTADYKRLAGTCNQETEIFTLQEMLQKAKQQDAAALGALAIFCDYLAAALINCLNLIDVHHIILSYYGKVHHILEPLLQEKINASLMASSYRKITVQPSAFCGHSPEFGAVAAAAEQVFQTLTLPASYSSLETDRSPS